MFDAPELNNHLLTETMVRTQPKVFAEINLNDPDNIKRIGVYRYRRNGQELRYRTLPVVFDPLDTGGHYVGAEMSYQELGYEDISPDNSSSAVFRQDDTYFNDLYPLEDCFKPVRPRSGVNKFLYLGGGRTNTTQFFDGSSRNPANRPRFYMSSKHDYFKYWTSYKREADKEYGISYEMSNSFPIDDAVPFVVYKRAVPANRLVVKMQTLVGTESVGSVFHNGQYINDPFAGAPRVPQQWSVEVLQNGSWNQAYSFAGSFSIPRDGHVELQYGIVIPDEFLNIYTYKGEVSGRVFLPENPDEGDLYLVRTDEDGPGTFWIANGTSWTTFAVRRGWTVGDNGFNHESQLVTQLVSPRKFGNGYEEFQMIEGMRVVVDTMVAKELTFDLIEMSPRLVMDWTDRSEQFSITKTMADMSNSAVPVGRLMASTGSISLSNNDSALNTSNSFNAQTGVGSIISNLLGSRIKISLYDVIAGVNSKDYYVPLKTLYSETTPNVNNEFSNVEMPLRDLYFLFESAAAPSLLMTDVSLSRAIMTLMDYVGFTNYTFKRLPGQVDPVIPYFFIPPDKNVAEVLSDLAMATQSAMYFDEFNNFVIATKEYILPEAGQRETDLVLSGEDNEILANIKEIASAERPVFNDGEIVFTKRYIQRTYGSLNQASYQPQDKTWIYAPTLLWEVAGDSSTKAVNEQARDQSSYTLTAMPLSTSLSHELPAVRGGRIINNTLNVGEAANYLARYSGYLYANGEIIRYDAAQYAVTGTGNVWVESFDDYQNYLLGLPFGGRMYPTGLIRIYSEPYRENGALVNGLVKRHGRGQFGTTVTSHEAGLGSHWSSNENVRGMFQNPESLFSMVSEFPYPAGLQRNGKMGKGSGGYADTLAKQSTRNGIIKNNLSQKFWSESDVNRMTAAQVGTVQSSALVFNGPTFSAGVNPRDHISYVFKGLSGRYTNFGTRCRIIGKVDVGASVDQTPIGSTPYFSIASDDPSSQAHVAGGSGGIATHVNPDTNAGYFFEIAALTTIDPQSYDVPDREVEARYGKVTAVFIDDDLVTLTVDQSGVTSPPSLSVGDTITVSDIYESQGPRVTGSHRVEQIGPDTVSYRLTIPNHTWTGLFGTVTKGGVPMGQVVSASLNEDGVISIGFYQPNSIAVNDTITLAGFDDVSGDFEVNQNAVVTSVSSDGRLIVATLPKRSYTYTSEGIGADSLVVKTATEKLSLSNIWFYKTMRDGKGGNILSYSRNASSTTVVVDSHQFSNNDYVTIWYGPASGAYQVVSINGNTITLNRGGPSATNVAYTSPYSEHSITLTDPVATTYKLWSGLTNVLVDSGQFWGAHRAVAEEKTTVYDLGIEFTETLAGRKFYLYINNRQVATVVDRRPLPLTGKLALFVRGSSKMMFENVYALGENITHSGVAKQVAAEDISEVFGIPDGINESDALRKYAVSGFVQSAFLSGISGSTTPQYNMYYDEFGTIMREAAYFNIKYDKAYPALYARLAPVLNRTKGYTVSGFSAGAYGAEFMVFNCLDNLNSIDESTGQYLRINGITFTQDTTKTLTVDEHLRHLSDVSEESILDPEKYDILYDDIKISRIKHGKNSFQISSDYIQTDDTASHMMGWVISKISRPRMNVGASIFPIPTLQLGDIVTIQYTDKDGKDVIIPAERQFVVYHIEIEKSANGFDMNVFITEV